MEYKVNNHQNLCRICLNTYEIYSMHSIYEDNINKILMSIVPTSILFEENCGLPTKICTLCRLEAININKYIKKILKSDKYLREQLKMTATNNLQLFNNTTILGSCEETTNLFVKCQPSNVDENHEMKFENSYVQEGVTIDPIENFQIVDEKSVVIKAKYSIPSCGNQDTHSKKKLVQCNECNENFEKKIYLRRHMETDHIEDDGKPKTFECCECTKMYSSQSLLLLHMKNHNAKLYTCKMCSKIFTRLDYLYEHEKRHTGERSFLCTKCGKGFFEQFSLQKHMKKMHSNDDSVKKQIFTCSICAKQLLYRNHLILHMRTHENRTIAEETEAEVTTSISNNNIINDANNNGNVKKSHLCSVCGRNYSSRSNLHVHMRRHTGEMTNFCKICGKGYPRTTDLIVHMRQHTGEKPFACKLCTRCFTRSDKLAIHMRTHTGEKPYICNICGRSFAQRNDLKSHSKRNTCENSILNKFLVNNNKQIGDVNQESLLCLQNHHPNFT